MTPFTIVIGSSGQGKSTTCATTRFPLLVVGGADGVNNTIQSLFGFRHSCWGQTVASNGFSQATAWYDAWCVEAVKEIKKRFASPDEEVKLFNTLSKRPIGAADLPRLIEVLSYLGERPFLLKLTTQVNGVTKRFFSGLLVDDVSPHFKSWAALNAPLAVSQTQKTDYYTKAKQLSQAVTSALGQCHNKAGCAVYVTAHPTAPYMTFPDRSQPYNRVNPIPRDHPAWSKRIGPATASGSSNDNFLEAANTQLHIESSNYYGLDGFDAGAVNTSFIIPDPQSRDAGWFKGKDRFNVHGEIPANMRMLERLQRKNVSTPESDDIYPFTLKSANNALVTDAKGFVVSQSYEWIAQVSAETEAALLASPQFKTGKKVEQLAALTEFMLSKLEHWEALAAKSGHDSNSALRAIRMATQEGGAMAQYILARDAKKTNPLAARWAAMREN